MTLAPASIGWWLMLLGAALVVFASSRYFTLDPAVYFPRQRAVYEANQGTLLLHVGSMVFALLLGPFQFLRSLRARRPAVHRLMGRVYLLGALAGGVAGLEMARFAASGPRAGLGFAFLAVGVLFTGAMAYRHIRAGRVQPHREWMTRNFALIFAAVTLRLYQPVLAPLTGSSGRSWSRKCVPRTSSRG
jgi:uncharacterized membrane protein